MTSCSKHHEANPVQEEFAQPVANIRGRKTGQAANRQRPEALFRSLLHGALNAES